MFGMKSCSGFCFTFWLTKLFHQCFCLEWRSKDL